ncbi:penicillin acylase family protein [Stella sp.]|uniref:penicillin acylase family protein n=1 Tax=Stella sp. TaxID=2912054 RepID=UPI0035B0DC8B
MRIVRRAFALLVLAAACLAAGGVLYLWTSLPPISATLAAPGLSAPARIERDRAGIVRIAAASPTDAYFALGLAHAQDRFAQMELQRRLAQGRLAELIGPAGIESDRFMRTLGIHRLAQQIEPTLDPETRSSLEAYAAGINFYLKSAAQTPPPEFVLLRHHPEPWTPADSVVWGKLMALQLSGNFRGEALRARMRQRMPLARIDALWPPALGPSTTEGASNAWVVGGDRSTTGKPILANDPHLGFRLPGIWHLSRIEAPGMTIAGAAFAGTPFHILGHNGRVAWGMTTTNADVADLVVEQVAADDPGQYETPDGPVPFAVREETIAVRGGAPIPIRIRTTRHGPVLSDVVSWIEPPSPGHVVALQATWLMPGDRSADAFRAMTRAGNAEAVRAALQRFRGPPQNVHFADTAGEFGMVTAGAIPIRADGDGWMPADGRTARDRWPAFIPFDRLPQRVGRPYEVIANANNRVVDESYPFFITREWDAPHRIARLLERLDEPGRHRVETSAAILADTVSGSARTLLPPLLALVARTPANADVLDRLRAWDGAMDRDRPEPLVFVAWLRELVRAVFADELGEFFEEFWDLRPVLVERVLASEPGWCDDQATPDRRETCADQATTALDRALEFLAGRYGANRDAWRWGTAHTVRFAPAWLGDVPLLGRLFSAEVATDGGHDTIHRGMMRVARKDAPFANVHGAGFRAVFDLADLDQSRFMIAGGQSGHPLSRHFLDLVQPWRDFAWLAMPALAVPMPGSRTLRLVPP